MAPVGFIASRTRPAVLPRLVRPGAGRTVDTVPGRFMPPPQEVRACASDLDTLEAWGSRPGSSRGGNRLLGGLRATGGRVPETAQGVQRNTWLEDKVKKNDHDERNTHQPQ